jgi:hypothetical protein
MHMHAAHMCAHVMEYGVWLQTGMEGQLGALLATPGQGTICLNHLLPQLGGGTVCRQALCGRRRSCQRRAIAALTAQRADATTARAELQLELGGAVAGPRLVACQTHVAPTCNIH